jgi:hypothetical protein
MMLIGITFPGFCQLALNGLSAYFSPNYGQTMLSFIASRRFWRFNFWACLGTVMLLALMPNDTDIPSLGWDKLNHLFAFAVMFMLGRQAYPERKRELLGGLFAYGILIELMQTLTPDRFMEVVDVVADSLGIAMGAAMDGLFRKRRQSG